MQAIQTRTSGPYNGDGTTTAFNYGYRILDETEIEVAVYSASGVKTVQTLTTHYTVSGVGAENGGQVTFVTAPASGTTVRTRGITDPKNEVDLVQNGEVNPDKIEEELDRLAMVGQDHDEQIGRALLGPAGETLDEIPDATTRAEMVLSFSASGKPETVISSASISSAASNAAAAAASAAAALVSETNAADSETAAGVSETNAAASAAAALAALSGAGFRYAYSDTTTDSDPGAGVLRLNNATIASATALYIDEVDADGSDLTNWLASWDDFGQADRRGFVSINGVDSAAAFAVFQITGSVVDGTGYRKVTLTHIASGGTFTDGADFLVSFNAAGADGADGASGAASYTTTSNPTANNDGVDTAALGQSFSPGDKWLNTSTDVEFVCVDASTGAAIWTATNVSGGVVGEVMAWAAAAVPSGFLACDGSAVSRTTYAALFAVIGTTFGAGDGSTTFNLPDLRDEFIRGSGSTWSVGDSADGQVGDHKHQLPFSGVNNTSGYADIYVPAGSGSNTGFHMWGTGDAMTPNRRQAGDASYTSPTSGYALTDKPYDSAADEATQETRPQFVALQFIIRYAQTYDVSDLTVSMPSASESAAGAVELATQAEVNTGTDTARAVTPAVLTGRLVGNWKYIGSLTASADATLEFTDLTEFDEYQFIISNLRPATDIVQFECRLSNDNGVSFINGASSYEWATNWAYTGSSATGNYVDTADDSIHFIGSGLDVGNLANEGVDGEIRMLGHKAARHTRLRARIMHGYQSAGPLCGSDGLAACRIAEAHDAVQFFFSSGNIASGSIYLIGRNHTT